MRIIAFIFTSILYLHGQAQWLRAENKSIKNDSDETVLLRGMGLGGWMLQEGYMFGLSFLGQQYRIRAKIEELIGADETAKFYDNWLQTHTTRADIDSLASWGFNSVRLPMHYALYTLPAEKEQEKGRDTWMEKGFRLTDSLLAWCRANRMYLILDLHAAPGGQGDDLAISDRDPSKPSLWESSENQRKTIALWKEIARRYANEPWIGGYDIINEPNWGFEDSTDKRGLRETKNIPLRKLMIDITKAIREVDSRHMIIIEGNGFGNNYRGVMPTWDNNLVLSFHKYGNFNDEKSIEQFLRLRAENNIPIWLGESGENSNTWFTEAISLCERHGIGWAWWQLKKMGINNPLEIKRPPGYQKLIDYWNGKAQAKPSRDESLSILTALLNNLEVRNNIFHPDVVDAMFRQVRESLPVPFIPHYIKGAGSIAATDFDMGGQRVSYYDLDSSRYQYTPGVNTVGNRGNMYRNDGVDISRDSSGYFINSIEAGEWLNYTIEIQKPGRYQIMLVLRSPNEDTGIDLVFDGEIAGNTMLSPSTNWNTTNPIELKLAAGKHGLRIKFNKPGVEFSKILFQLDR